VIAEVIIKRHDHIQVTVGEVVVSTFEGEAAWTGVQVSGLGPAIPSLPLTRERAEQLNAALTALLKETQG
jgi:hypothetical protein